MLVLVLCLVAAVNNRPAYQMTNTEESSLMMFGVLVELVNSNQSCLPQSAAEF